jgi:hypothetical protein
MATTTENIVFDTTINLGNSTNSVKSLKSELKDLRNQLGTLEQGSEAFNQAAQRAGQLQEQIRGVNDAIENADPEKKFAPFARTLQGMAGGFAAVQGAMGLFGSESKDLEKTLLKVQSAMALSQGLNSLLEFKNDFADLGKNIIQNVVKAFTTLRGAIIATGIGLLAVTVGVLVTNWKEFSQAITDAFPGFKVVTDFFSNLKQVAAGTLEGIVQGFKVLGTVVTKVFQGDFSGAIDAAKTFGEKVAIAYNQGYAEEDRKIKIQNGLKDRQFALDLEEAKGKDVKAKRVKLMQDELSILKKGSDEYNAKLIEIEKAKTDLRKEAAEKKDKEDEDAKNKRDAFDKDNAERAKEYDEKEKKRIEETRTRNSSLLVSEQEKRAAHINDLNEIAKDEVLSAEERYAALDELNQKGILSDKQTADAKIAIAEAEQNAKLSLVAAYGQTLNQIANLLGKSTAEGKAVAIAATTIDTYVAAFRAYKEGFKLDPSGVFSIISAAAATATGIAAVQNIISTPVPGGGGGGGTVPNFTAPSIPQIPQSVSGTRLNQTDPLRTINEGRDSKVFVTETDITKTQNKVKNIIKKATIK